MPDRFAVLLATFNGARFLDEQLRSLEDQTVDRLDVFVSDDGSTDETRAILERWSKRWTKGRFVVEGGPCAGFVENFRSLMTRPDIDADFVAFSDQDDVWDADKLARVRAALSDDRLAPPVLYCGRTRAIDEEGRPLGLSPLMRKPPAFRNALVQSIAGANTMVLDRAGFALVAETAKRTTFVSHDWWCYMVVTGAGGAVIYDPEPAVSYRQHGSNLVGANTGWRARARRIVMLLTTRFAGWNTLNGGALAQCRDLLNDDARTVVEDFFGARQAGRLALIGAIRRQAVHRQSGLGQIALFVAAALRRL